MDQKTREQNLEVAIRAAVKGGQEILKVYSGEFDVELKDDASPLTQADKNAHLAIEADLINTQLPILSEEGKAISYEERRQWNYFWMVDPLDGTKEFVKRNGEFTVNIALIHQGVPVAGVIYVPVTGVLYFGMEGTGAFKVEEFDASQGDLAAWMSQADQLPKAIDRSTYTIVASRSHLSDETKVLLQQLEAKHGAVDIASMGSSLKICLVAEGAADMYPRFAPTMEWDTAAGHAIVLGAGKQIIDHTTGQPMVYNKQNLLNNWFVVQ